MSDWLNEWTNIFVISHFERMISYRLTQLWIWIVLMNFSINWMINSSIYWKRTRVICDELLLIVIHRFVWGQPLLNYLYYINLQNKAVIFLRLNLFSYCLRSSSVLLNIKILRVDFIRIYYSASWVLTVFIKMLGAMIFSSTNTQCVSIFCMHV